jgi:fumarate hydratase subunit alpha
MPSIDEGGSMKTISLSQVSEAVKRLYMEACYETQDEMLNAFRQAAEREESPTGKEILQLLLENAALAKEEGFPMCQDTGMTVVFVDLGEEVRFDGGGLVDAVNRGVAEACREGYLRASVVADPLERVNTRDNTPAVVHISLVPGDTLRLKVAAKGTGAENMSALRMMSPAQGVHGIKEFVLETVRKAGPNACPPVVVGIGLGGNFETCPLLAKRALFRELGSRNPRPHLARLEEEILAEINALGIGPQGLGGTVTALAVHLEAAPCHIGSLPVAVNLECHAHRYKEAVL